MRAVLTRVKSASVSVDGKTIGSIGPGFLILLGITHDDTEAQAVKLADKLTGLRIFEDEDGKMNRGLDTVNGEILVISQFTLYGNCRKGRRPEFLAAARPEVAIPLYEKWDLLKENAAAADAGVHAQQTHNGHGGHALAAAAFTHKAHHRVPGNFEADTIHGPQGLFSLADGNL